MKATTMLFLLIAITLVALLAARGARDIRDRIGDRAAMHRCQQIDGWRDCQKTWRAYR